MPGDHGSKHRQKKWTAEAVIAGLRDFYSRTCEGAQGAAPPSLELVNPPLHGGARRVFGTFKAAMLAAGLPYPPQPPSPWTTTTLIEGLQRLHAQGHDLSLSAVKDRHGGSLLGPALHRFGSWRKALEAAGIHYSAVSRVREWSRKTVLQELKRRHEAGRSTGGGAVQKQDARLWAAAKRHFGSYRNALEVAGIPIAESSPEWSWSPPQLRQALRELHIAGVNLSSSSLRRTHAGLFYAARSRLGSWRKAIESIGVDYDAVRKARDWSREAIIERLKELHSAGVDLRTGVIQKSDIPLSGAVQRYFGTMREAMKAAGLAYPERSSATVGHWTEDLVLNQLRDLHNQGVDLRHSTAKRNRQPLFWAAKHFFGSYVNAVRQAGIDYAGMSQLHLSRDRESKRCAR